MNNLDFVPPSRERSAPKSILIGWGTTQEKMDGGATPSAFGEVDARYNGWHSAGSLTEVVVEIQAKASPTIWYSLLNRKQAEGQDFKKLSASHDIANLCCTEVLSQKN